MSHIETKNQTNELLAFESSLLAKTFFEQAMVTVGPHGSHVRWGDGGRAQAAATLANAAAQIYAAKLTAAAKPKRIARNAVVATA